MENLIQCDLADDGTANVTLLGEIDFSNSDEVADGIRRAVAEWRPSSVRIDLKDAAFIDSSGLGALIEGYQVAAAQECTFVVTNPSANLRRVLSVTGLAELFGLTAEIRVAEEAGAQAAGA